MIYKILKNQNIAFLFGLVIVTIYLLPLFQTPLYISIFDNLDSTIVYLKILANSGQIFAASNDIVPNMMNGLPRASYGSEFNIILWLYYFFEPKIAYSINQILIHYVAFVSMYIFLKRYIIVKSGIEFQWILLSGSLYFGLLPFFSPEGLSIPLLPLVTFSLLNIKNYKSSIFDWLFLILLPLYTDFIFIYVFYIIMAGIYMFYDAFQNKKFNKLFFLALILMGITFLLREYRLVFEMFIDSEFISHRIDFNLFLKYDFLESLRRGHSFFLNGHTQHLIDLQMPYMIPVIIVAMLLSLSNKKFTNYESMIIWMLILISFATDIWSFFLSGLYSLPSLFVFSILILWLTKFTKTVALLFLLQLCLALFTVIMFCQCAREIIEYLPILKVFNITRLTFIQPLVWAVLLVSSLNIYASRMYYTFWFILLFIFVQTVHEFNTKEFFTTATPEYASFENYYAPNLFKNVKMSMASGKNRVVSFGLEPAVSLYNGFYTVDGYSTNYPLEYKVKFRKVVEKHLNNISEKNNFDEWGSKVYILGVISTPKYYQKGLVVQVLPFYVQPLCALDTDYLISAYEINSTKNSDLILQSNFIGEKNSWDIYLYKIICSN